MATTTAVDQSKLCKIINNSGTDIVVALPLNSGDTDYSNPVVSYNKDIEILVTSSGGTVIKNGSTDTVTLDQTYIDPKTKKPRYAMGYNLLVSSSAWLSPIANLGILQDFMADPPVFKPQTVSADSVAAMQQTVAFYQTIAAYPNSQLAKDYVASLGATNNKAGTQATGSATSAADVSNTIEGGVTGFFKNTKSYQQVTLANIIALESYYNIFPFAWAAYADVVSYYLYSSDGSQTSFQGTLLLKKAGPVDITKPNGGYACSFIPAVDPADTTITDVDDSKAKTLTYSRGIFVDDVSSDMPQVSLMGIFQLKRTFTKDPNDTSIIVVITGTINNITSVGFDSAQATSSGSDGGTTTADWLKSLFFPKSAEGVFNSFMTIAGALMMIHFVGSSLWEVVKWAKQKIAGNETAGPDELKATQETFDADLKSQIDAIYKKVMGDKSASAPATPEEALTTATNSLGEVSTSVGAGQAKTNVEKLSETLENLETYAAGNPDLNIQVQEAAENIADAWNDFNTNPDLSQAVTDLNAQVTDLSTQITSISTDVKTEITSDQETQYNEDVKGLEDVQANVEKTENAKKNEEEDAASDDPKAETRELPEEIEA